MFKVKVRTFLPILCILCTLIVSLFITVDCAEAKTKSTWSTWQSYKQASWYDEYWSTASGIHTTYGIAVDYRMVCKKSTWKHSSKSFKKSHFYYGEKVILKHGKYKVTCTVVDCGGFKSSGQYYKGSWRSRWFDLQPKVKRALHMGDVGIVKWKFKN